MKLKLLLIISVLICVMGCKGGKMRTETVDLSELKAVSQEKWDKLANKKIYFGHQSVGYNIIDGIKDIMAEMPNIKLNIQETKNPKDFVSPIFAHSPIGKNKDPYIKIDDFKRIMESGVADKADIAFFKFCYIDINPETDRNKVFAHYKTTMGYLEQKYPNTIFVHWSVPVRTTNTSFKAIIRRLLNKDVWGEKDNIARNKYNRLLIDAYGGKARFFDVALHEATSPKGKVTLCAKGDKDCVALWQGYSEDGGHLSSLGKKNIGQKLLSFLATERE